MIQLTKKGRRTARELIVDTFAGGGGASLGIRRAVGRCPDLAINHDPAAIAMHKANHPDTRHMTEDVWNVDPLKATKRRQVGLLWASPDCRHFSRAKGGKPVKKSIRSLAFVVIKWAREVKPRVIILENVREFEEWGPLAPVLECKACGKKQTAGQANLARSRPRCAACNSVRLEPNGEELPDPTRKGLTFRRWVGRLRAQGYKVEWRSVVCANYGDPTLRRRLVLIARCDGKPIVWPEATHGDPAKFDATPLFQPLQPWRTAAEQVDWSIRGTSIFDRAKPLAEKSMWRIAMGFKRFVLDAAKPFIVQLGYGEREGQAARVLDIDQPLGTIVGGGNKFGLVSAWCAKWFGGVIGHGLNRPLGTITQIDHHSLVTAHLTKFRGDSLGQPLDLPCPTITSGAGAARPAGAAHALALTTAYLVRANHGDKQWNSLLEPSPTVTTQHNKFGLVCAFLIKYFGTAIGQGLEEPLHTVTGKARFGIVRLELVPGYFEDAVALVLPGLGTYFIGDITLRMFVPRELARCQGFDDGYRLIGSQTSQIAKIGNSVPPGTAAAHVAANGPF